MLDKKTERMLQAASMLTAEDLDGLRETTVAVVSDVDEDVPPEDPPVAVALPEAGTDVNPSDLSRGERERQRTRESKVSTSCIGRKRENHEWWPVGTELAVRSIVNGARFVELPVKTRDRLDAPRLGRTFAANMKIFRALAILLARYFTGRLAHARA